MMLHTVSFAELALGYAMAAGIALALAFGMSMDIRLTLAFVGAVNDSYYNSVTFHGLLMIFGAMMPVLFGVIGNGLLPTLTGLSDMIFPRTNTAGLYVLINSITLFIASIASDDVLATGWTLYPPLSYIQGSALDVTIVALHLAGISSLVLALNSLLTTFSGKGNLLQMHQLPLMAWALSVANFLLIIVLPVLAAGITMLLLDRTCNTCYFAPATSGDLTHYQHLFWFFGHPEVYVLVLPAFGFMSHLIQVDAQSNVLNHVNMLIALMGIGTISMLVWAHHMYTVGMDVDSRAYFSWATLLIAVPTGAKYYSWIASFYHAPMIPNAINTGTLAFMWFFLFGGFTGVLLANAGLDLLLHDTYYVVAHFHIVMAVAIVYIIVSMLLHIASMML